MDFLARIAKIFYLAYLAACSPRAAITNRRYLPRELPAGRNVIYVFWHSKTFLIMPYCRGRGIGVLTLTDPKNYFYDRLCAAFGYRTVPVRSAAMAARRLEKMLTGGSSVALAVDGPRGPAGAVRPGAVYLARKTKKPIVAVRVEAGRALRLRKRWDRYEIPLPFARTFFTVSEPIHAFGRAREAVEADIRAALGAC